MKVYVSEKDRNKGVEEISLDVRNVIHSEIDRLWKANKNNPEFMERTENAFGWPLAKLEEILDIEYVPEKLTFYTFNNLRCQQDGVVSEVKRFDKLEDAIKEYNSLPREYTTALGGCLGEMKEIDFIHRRNGENVLVTDYRNMDDWVNNGLVKQAVELLVNRLNVEYQSDIQSLGLYCPVLVPLSDQTKINSYFKDKYLYPKVSNRLLSAINEVYEEGEGWIKFEDFYHKLDNVSPSKETYRPKVTKYNVTYVDHNGRTGQADLSPADFALLKKQTEEFLSKRPNLDTQIKGAVDKTPNQESGAERNDREPSL